MDSNLRDCLLFSHLNEAQLATIKGQAHEVRLNDGQLFFQAGDPASRFFLVLEGQIKLSRLSLKGSEKVIELISTGETFAEALMFGEQPRFPVNATAIGTTRLLSFDNQSYLEVLRGSNEACFKLMADMSQRLKHLINEIELLSLQNATFRLADFIWKRWEMLQPDGVAIELEVPKAVIASRLSVTPETFSRTLNVFSGRGLIEVDGNRILILDPDGLRALADPIEMNG
jgi:CRP-like cAMP-binding protein